MSLLQAVRVAQEGGTSNYLLLGLFYGLATASKINAATFGMIVFAACADEIIDAAAPVSSSQLPVAFLAPIETTTPSMNGFSAIVGGCAFGGSTRVYGANDS